MLLLPELSCVQMTACWNWFVRLTLLVNTCVTVVCADDLGRALQASDTNGLYCDLLSFLLTSIFQLQEEEEEYDAGDVDAKGEGM